MIKANGSNNEADGEDNNGSDSSEGEGDDIYYHTISPDFLFHHKAIPQGFSYKPSSEVKSLVDSLSEETDLTKREDLLNDVTKVNTIYPFAIASECITDCCSGAVHLNSRSYWSCNSHQLERDLKDFDKIT